MTQPATIRSLNSIDWNFAHSPTNAGIHSIHPYPAKFIPQIPQGLIDLFYPGNGVILDPFCGSGTTLVQAISSGIDAWGVDLNPLACLIAKVKTTPLFVNLEEVARNVSHASQEQLAHNVVTIPAIPNLDHWFKPEIQRALAVLTTEINQEPETAIREALQVALSSIIVRVSNQESDTRYAAVDKKLLLQDVFKQFERAGKTLGQALYSLRDNLFRQLGCATIIHHDILTIKSQLLPKNVGLVVTSPPYPNAYEYWLYHKYRMYWLGMNPIKVREEEIGARPHYFKTNHQDEHDFERQMSFCFRLLSSIMLPDAKACFLIGRSIIHGREIVNAALLQRAALINGFNVEGVIQRDILTTHKSFNPAHSKIAQEHILVFSLQR